MFKINKNYNFTTLSPEILGGSYIGMKVKMIMSAEEAVKFRDIHTLHQTLLTVIDGLPEDINDCTFLLFEPADNSKSKQVIASEYIDIFSISEVSTQNLRIEIFDVNTNTLGIIRTRLSELGIKNFKISTF